MVSADRDEIRAAVAARYAGLARAAQAGQAITDGDPDAGCSCSRVPGHRRPARGGGAGQPGLRQPGRGGGPAARVRRCWTWARAAASTCCSPPAGSAPAGKAYGLDMTEEMLDLARANARAAGADNVEFLRGQIEAIPLPDGSVDVIISNCVINLSTDRPAVFAESFRVLRPGGRLGISDILAEDHLTPAERLERGAQVGCIAGAPSFAEYRDGLTRAGFTGITITPTQQVGDGVHSAIIRAVRP